MRIDCAHGLMASHSLHFCLNRDPKAGRSFQEKIERRIPVDGKVYPAVLGLGSYDVLLK